MIPWWYVVIGVIAVMATLFVRGCTGP